MNTQLQVTVTGNADAMSISTDSDSAAAIVAQLSDPSVTVMTLTLNDGSTAYVNKANIASVISIESPN